MAVQISDPDKARARHHMGYLGVEQAQTFVLGIPAAVQTQFMIEGAMVRLLAESLPRFYLLLERLDCLECEVFGGSDLADIESMGEIKVNRMRLKELSQYYLIAQQGLANLLGIVPNPFDQRIWLQGRKLNISVSG